ncbi:WD40 repeat domain-containing protein [Thermogemmatispora sp.]|uniref:WD40 repeat domain-containing protein n=1 Tax=Thermogemmatispora sp. TaxID=1968838 RepID=UPI0035E42FBA
MLQRKRNGMLNAWHGLFVGLTVWEGVPGPEGDRRLPAGGEPEQGIRWSSAASATPTAADPLIFRAPAGQTVVDIAWSPDSRRLAYCTWGYIPDLRICDLATRRTLLLYPDEQDGVALVTGLRWFSSGCGRLCSLGDWRPPLLSGHSAGTEAADPGSVVRSVGLALGLAGASLHVFAWSPDGSRVALASDQQVVVRAASSGQVLATYPASPSPGGQPSYCLAWSPDGRLIASAGRLHALDVWDAASGQPWRSFPEQAQAIAAAWSPDGRFLAYMLGNNLVANPGRLLPVQVVVREVRTGVQVLVLKGRFLVDRTGIGLLIYPHSLAWSPDSRYLLAAGQDAEVQVWEVAAQRLVCSYRGHCSCVLAVAWSPDGRRIASAGQDGTIRIWEAPRLPPG